MSVSISTKSRSTQLVLDEVSHLVGMAFDREQAKEHLARIEALKEKHLEGSDDLQSLKVLDALKHPFEIVLQAEGGEDNILLKRNIFQMPLNTSHYLQQIMAGSFASIPRVRSKNSTKTSGVFYCGDVVEKRRENGSDHFFQREKLMYLSLSHDCLLKVEGILPECLILERAQCDLFDCVSTRNQYYIAFSIGRYIDCVLDAIDYLHELAIVHCDIKLENVFVVDESHAKLGDFEGCKILPNQLVKPDPQYASPEALSSKPVSCKSDIWSLGVAIANIVLERGSISTIAILKEIKRKTLFFPLASEIDPSGRLGRLARACLVTSEEKRPSIQEVKKLSCDLIQRIQALSI